MKAIIGTAGHIDHGKTALVRSLTGIDTDRLPEERDRGISIELGFAYLELPDGDRAGIVDVPGHERFIRQMLAGAHGFDLVLLMVAADDGVMPQTEEHFEICHLLGVRRAIVVITKADVADDARISEVREEIEILVAGTRFEAAPVAVVSSRTGAGIDELRRLVTDNVLAVERMDSGGPFRMPVDRVFVLRGHGLIVTGTAAAGSVASGDELRVWPGGFDVRVRETQVHERTVDRAFAGERVALNVVGADRGELKRGDYLADALAGGVTDRFDALVEIRPSAGKPVKSHQRVRVHLGTRETPARIIWIGDADAVEPRDEGFAQLVLDGVAPAFVGDRFVLRDETASRTLGGGLVLIGRAEKHRKRDKEVVRRLRLLSQGEPEDRLAALCELVPNIGLSPAEAASAIGIDVGAVIRLAGASPRLIPVPEAENPAIVVSTERYRAFADAIIDRVARHHEEHTNLVGLELESLRCLLPYDVEPRLFRSIVDRMVAAQQLTRRGSIVSLPGHSVSMTTADEALAAAVLAEVVKGGLMPPTLKELAVALSSTERKLAECVGVLVERGEVIRVSAEIVYTSSMVAEIESKMRAHLAEKDRISAAEFRDLLSTSRKYSIPMLDYFDRVGVTIRTGDYRRLRSA